MLDEAQLIWKVRCMEKHGGEYTDLAPWAEFRAEYRRAIRYLEQRQLPVPENLRTLPTSRGVMQRYINDAADAQIQNTMIAHLQDSDGANLEPAAQRQLQSRMRTRTARVQLARATAVVRAGRADLTQSPLSFPPRN